MVSRERRPSSLDKCLDHSQQQGFDEVDTPGFTWVSSKGLYCSSKMEGTGSDAGNQMLPQRSWQTHKANVVRENLERSSKEFKTDQVDMFNLHAPDLSVPYTKNLEEVNKLHREGKFVKLGLSNYTIFEMTEIVARLNERDWARLMIYQGMYNAISEAQLCPKT